MSRARSTLAILALSLISAIGCQRPAEYDLILRGPGMRAREGKSGE